MTQIQQNYKELPSFLKSAIDSHIKIAIDEEFEEAKKRIEKRKSEIIAGILLHTQRMIEVNTTSEHLIITIKLEDK